MFYVIEKMKFKITFILYLLILGLSSNTFKQLQDSNKTIVWTKSSHDFGTLKQGEMVETDFSFQNTGKDTLTIENVMGSCGCLATSWPKQSILPNQKGSITVKFNSNGKSGQHLKSVTVYSNLGAYYLEIKANIVNP